MDPSLAQARRHLDDATEDLTFDELRWAFEEAWWGAAWALNAHARRPHDALELGQRGALPVAGSLRALERRARRLPRPLRLAARFERLRDQLAAAPEALEAQLAAAIVEAVWDAWALHRHVAEVRGCSDPHGGRSRGLAEPGRAAAATSVAVAPEPGTVNRRQALRLLGLSALVPVGACSPREPEQGPTAITPSVEPPGSPAPAPAVHRAQASVRSVEPMVGMQWATSDPFLFCAHHRDDYPEGSDAMAPAASLEGRLLGRDFDGKDGWNMYHGRTVPGFPRHPHRGFETVTVVRTGRLDHADSMGAAARYGGGDVQWLTAGGGIQHAEMFPLLRSDAKNPLELFQIWLNLPAADKMAPPHFTMLWSEQIPRLASTDAQGRAIELTVSAGSYEGHRPPPPPPSSWAARPEADLAIWNLVLAPGAHFTLPEVAEGTERSLYVYRGGGLTIGGTAVGRDHRAIVEGRGEVALVAGREETEVLLLQGRPIGEPVARRGPFVMNTDEEIRQAYRDYQATSFGGWPWPDDAPVHARDRGRFARLLDGTLDEPPG